MANDSGRGGPTPQGGEPERVPYDHDDYRHNEAHGLVPGPGQREPTPSDGITVMERLHAGASKIAGAATRPLFPAAPTEWTGDRPDHTAEPAPGATPWLVEKLHDRKDRKEESQAFYQSLVDQLRGPYAEGPDTLVRRALEQAGGKAAEAVAAAKAQATAEAAIEPWEHHLQPDYRKVHDDALRAAAIAVIDAQNAIATFPSKLWGKGTSANDEAGHIAELKSEALAHLESGGYEPSASDPRSPERVMAEALGKGRAAGAEAIRQAKKDGIHGWSELRRLGADALHAATRKTIDALAGASAWQTEPP